MNILVSGVAGDIGFGVGRILKEWQKSCITHGIDIQANHAGPFVFDYCAIAPKASSPEYLDWIQSYILKHKIDVFIPTSEAEISRITIEGFEQIGGAQILVANHLTVMKSLDKYECLKFLSSNKIPVPANGLVGVQDPTSFPIIVKPRSGQGGKGIMRVNKESEFRALELNETSVWQDYLVPDDEEYTCPIYNSASTGLLSLILRRKLEGSTTVSGEVVDIEEITQYIESIALALSLEGAINIQLRLTSNGPLLFEINPRLSSTLVFRDKLGFQDLRWWLADKLNLESPVYKVPKVGTRFYRGAQEYILPN